MGFELDGFDDLYQTLEALGNVGNKVTNDALKAGAEVVLKEQKNVASKFSDDGVNELKVDKIKKYGKSKSSVIRVGILEDGSNWEDVKGLWFQHWGFEHYKNGELVNPHQGWVDEAFDNAKANAERAMIDKVSKEIDDILG